MVTVTEYDEVFQRKAIDGEIEVSMIAILENDQEDYIYLYEYDNQYLITVNCYMAAMIYTTAETYDNVNDAKADFLAICEEQNENRTDNGFDPIEPKFFKGDL